MITTKFKIETVFTPSPDNSDNKSRLGVTEFIIDGFVVCTMKKYREWFRSMQKDGHMSILRDKQKVTFRIVWNKENIEKLTGKKVKMASYSIFDKYDFKDEYPDLNMGFTVNCITSKDVRYYMTNFIEKKVVIKRTQRPKFNKDVISYHFDNIVILEKSYSIKWCLEDISGNCSPSGSTTIDSGEIFFDNVSEKDAIVEQIVRDNSGADPRYSRLYITLRTFVLESEEDIQF